jgi:hypothetical protein
MTSTLHTPEYRNDAASLQDDSRHLYNHPRLASPPEKLANPAPRITTSHLEAGFRQHTILKGISTSIFGRCVTAIMGPSGCGMPTHPRLRRVGPSGPARINRENQSTIQHDRPSASSLFQLRITRIVGQGR